MAAGKGEERLPHGAAEPHGPGELRDTQVLAVRPVVRLVPIAPERWLVATGDERSEIRGRSVATLLPTVLAAVDGTRSVGEVVSHLARHRRIAPGRTRDCLTRLYRWYILDDRSGYHEHREERSPILERQRRYLALFSSRPVFHQAALATTRVAVTGVREGAADTRCALGEMGLRVSSANSLEGVDFAVVWGTGLGDPTLLDRNRECVDARVPLLVITQQGALGHLGPTVLPGQGPCWECVIEHLEGRWRWKSGSRNGGEFGDTELSTSEDGLAARSLSTVLAHWAALEIFRLATPCLRAGLIGRRQAHRLDSAAFGETAIVRRPRCACCGALVRRGPVASFQERGDLARGV